MWLIFLVALATCAGEPTLQIVSPVEGELTQLGEGARVAIIARDFEVGAVGQRLCVSTSGDDEHAEWACVTSPPNDGDVHAFLGAFEPTPRGCSVRSELRVPAACARSADLAACAAAAAAPSAAASSSAAPPSESPSSAKSAASASVAAVDMAVDAARVTDAATAATTERSLRRWRGSLGGAGCSGAGERLLVLRSSASAATAVKSVPTSPAPSPGVVDSHSTTGDDDSVASPRKPPSAAAPPPRKSGENGSGGGGSGGVRRCARGDRRARG